FPPRRSSDLRLVSPFGGDSRLRQDNPPLIELTRLPPGTVIPRFWLAAGAADGSDVANAERFWRELPPPQPEVPLTLTPGTGHTMTTWRAQVPAVLPGMPPAPARAAHQQPPIRRGRPAVLAVTRPAR